MHPSQNCECDAPTTGQLDCEPRDIRLLRPPQSQSLDSLGESPKSGLGEGAHNVIVGANGKGESTIPPCPRHGHKSDPDLLSELGRDFPVNGFTPKHSLLTVLFRSKTVDDDKDAIVRLPFTR